MNVKYEILRLEIQKKRHQNQLFLPLFDSDSFGLYFEEKWLGLLGVKRTNTISYEGDSVD